MSIAEDPVAIIGSAFSLPGGADNLSKFWSLLVDGDWSACSTSTPDSRAFKSLAPDAPNYIERAGWLGREGVEDFDAAFFDISPGEAQSLRPNCRLALELTHKALENAGIPLASLKGKNVAVSIAVGTEDGWDMRRAAQGGKNAFDHNWATSSEPSAVSGRVAHFFDFHGACSTVSNACAGGAFALREGIHCLFDDDADLAIVGAISTHCHPAAFAWASSVGVASRSGRCSAFSDEADGYVPSEGAVIFVLKRKSLAQAAGNAIDGLIRGIAVGHNGATRTLTTPNVATQINVAQRAFSAAGLSPSDVMLLEAHGTGTKLGDMLEMEAIRAIYGENRATPLIVSSAKTIMGHCQAAAPLVGILKVLSCFKHRVVPPHHVPPREVYTSGNIQVPVKSHPLDNDKTLHAAVSSFGFTGGVASIILETPPPPPDILPSSPASLYLCPFSAKSGAALLQHIRSVGKWAQANPCGLAGIASALCLARDHYKIRHAIVVSDVKELVDHCLTVVPSITPSIPIASVSEQVPGVQRDAHNLLPLLNLDGLREEICHGQERTDLDSLISSGDVLGAAALLYSRGHDLAFDSVLKMSSMSASDLRSFPTYPFQRSEWWNNTSLPYTPGSVMRKNGGALSEHRPMVDETTANMQVSRLVASVLNLPQSNLHQECNIFDIGIDSINSIELAQALSSHFGKSIGPTDLYSLLTVGKIAETLNTADHLVESRHGPDDQRVAEFVEEFGAPFQHDFIGPRATKGEMNILLTGAAGTLGSALLARLLTLPAVRVFCLIRGSPEKRLHNAFIAKGYPTGILDAALASGRLCALTTLDLSEPFLGCAQEDYAHLLQEVNVIIHGAWRLDFNIPLYGFRQTLLATRRLAEFCAQSVQKVAFHFITSFSTSFGYPGESVPEEPLECIVEYALPQGYALSKLVAEHALYRLQNDNPDLFHVNIIRVGQICGHSQTGAWSREEMIPMMLASLPMLQAVPRDLPDVSWIPSDICADALVDIVTNSRQNAIEVHNVANPKIVPWAQVVRDAVDSTLPARVRLVSWAEYVAIIHSARDLSPPVARLLPYFEDCVARGVMPPRFCSLDVTGTAQRVASLAACPELTLSFVRKLLSWINTSFAREESVPVTSAASKQLSSLPVNDQSPVFLFGPWSAKFTAPEGNEEYTRIVSLLVDYAVEYAQGPIDELGTALMIQLQTLALQLATLEQMRSRGVTPHAVVGYCFGEFAAAIAARILSERTVVSILVQRASALRHVSGTMLNVFTDLTTVRARLAGMSSPPDVAIIAGPQHIVLSGSTDDIAEAKAAFDCAAVKTVAIPTSIPYHSREVDTAIETFGRMPPYPVNRGRCIYVSCVTGSIISPERLGVNYWLRHMRDPVRFLSSMETVRSHLRKGILVDIGPNIGLPSVVARYRWDGFRVIPASDFLRSFCSVTRDTPVEVVHPTKGTGESLVPGGSQMLTSTPLLSSLNGPAGPPFILDHSPGLPDSPVHAALEELSSILEYEASAEILHETFHSLGIDSLAFVRFSEGFEKRSGQLLSPSHFTSNLSLGEIFSQL